MTRIAFTLCALLLVSAPLPVRTAQTGPPLRHAALDAIDRSPRHGEWIGIEIAGAPPLRAWITYPERSDKAPVIILLHTLRELDDWTRAVVDQLAADGFIAIAPELVNVTAATLSSRVDAVGAYARGIPAANQRTAVVVLDDRLPAIASEWTPGELPMLRIEADDTGRTVQQAWMRVLAELRTKN